jgi:hypothetical protein
MPRLVRFCSRLRTRASTGRSAPSGARATSKRRWGQTAVAARIAFGLTSAQSGACGPSLAPEAHLASERSFLRLGVELEHEEEAVRHVLAQRRLSVASEVRGPIFIALGASTFDGRLSAIRVISPRGVIHAEDAAQDDLFAPASVRLLERFPPMLGEYYLVAWTRIALGRDLGCVSLIRILPDGSAVPAVLDVSALGPRACVADVRHAAGGRLTAELAFPGLFAGQTPSFSVELAFQQVLLGREAPLIPVAKLAADGTWLEAERARLEGLVRNDAPLDERHVLGVGRAAIALLAGLSTEAQVAAYRSTVGRVIPGSTAAAFVADTLDYIEHGWADPEAGDATADPSGGPGADPEDLLIEPPDAGTGSHEGESQDSEPSEDVLIIEPHKRH